MAGVVFKHYGVVREKGIEFHDRKRLRDNLLPLRDKQVVVTIEKLQDARGINQVRYLWGVLYAAIAEHTGHEPEEIHDFCKAKFLSEPLSIGFETVVRVGSTKPMTYEEMETFTRKVREWAAAELDISVPARGEVSFA